MAGAMNSAAAGERVPSDAPFSVRARNGQPHASNVGFGALSGMTMQTIRAETRCRSCPAIDAPRAVTTFGRPLCLRTGYLWLFEVVEEGSQAADGAAADRADAAHGHGYGAAYLRVAGLRWVQLQLDEASFPVG